MSKAAELAALIGSGQAQGDKNLIINGAMAVAQRGVSTTGIGNGGFITDRFFYDRAGLGVTATFNSSQASDAPSAFQYSAKVDCTTAQTLGASGGTYIGIKHKIEGYNVRQLRESAFTLSFYVKSTKTGIFSIVLKNSGADRFYCAEYTVSSSDTWERKNIQIDAIPSDGTWNFTNGTGLDVFWCIAVAGDVDTGTLDAWTSGTMPFGSSNQVEGADSTSNNFLITGVQLEGGETATPFEHESYAATLQKCQRYFQKRVFTDADAIWVGANFNATSAYGVIEHIVTMRTEPSGAYSGTLADYKYYSAANTKTPIAMAINSRNSENSSETHIDWSGDLNSGGAGWLRAIGTNAFVQLEAEL